MSKKVEGDLPPLILIKDLDMLYPTENSKRRYRYGLYKCGLCGNEFRTQINNVKNGNTKSCGCYKKRRMSETHKTHGLRSTRLYDNWDSMKSRTLNPKNKDYPNYGGRGITICDEWKNDVQNFYDWAMSNGYEENKGLSIDRIDNDGNYCPENCRWVDSTIQGRNRRRRKDNTSGYKGVSFVKDRNKYKSYINVDKNEVYLGYFKTAEDGAIAYNNYIIANDLEGFPLNKLPDSHIHLQLPTKPHHQILE